MENLKIVVLLALLFSVLVSVLSTQFVPLYYSIIIFVLSFVLFLLFLFAYFEYKKANAKRKIESILPDFLSLVAANIRAGMPPSLALKNSVRPEFSPLSEEITYATNLSLGTDSFVDVLFQIPKKFNSDLLERVISLFVTGHLSGGNLPLILEDLAEDIRETKEVKEKVAMGVDIYVIFLVFSMIIVMPLLFSVSYTYLFTIQDTAGVSVDLTSLMMIFSIYLILTSLIVGGFIGLIKKGKIISGLLQGLSVAIISCISFIILTELLKILFLMNL